MNSKFNNCTYLMNLLRQIYYLIKIDWILLALVVAHQASYITKTYAKSHIIGHHFFNSVIRVQHMLRVKVHYMSQIMQWTKLLPSK